jgi:hypothetical protein
LPSEPAVMAGDPVMRAWRGMAQLRVAPEGDIRITSLPPPAQRLPSGPAVISPAATGNCVMLSVAEATPTRSVTTSSAATVTARVRNLARWQLWREHEVSMGCDTLSSAPTTGRLRVGGGGWWRTGRGKGCGRVRLLVEAGNAVCRLVLGGQLRNRLWHRGRRRQCRRVGCLCGSLGAQPRHRIRGRRLRHRLHTDIDDRDRAVAEKLEALERADRHSPLERLRGGGVAQLLKRLAAPAHVSQRVIQVIHGVLGKSACPPRRLTS